MGHGKIMIVEDDEDLHILYGLYLQGQDYQILRAYNGREAFQILETERPDLIILDMIMPIMDGEEFLTRLRTEKNILDIPVIIASVNDKIPARLLEIGRVHKVMRKPVTIEELLNHIQEVLAARP